MELIDCGLSIHLLINCYSTRSAVHCSYMFCVCSSAAVQNERQPRSTAHVSLDSISMDNKTEHLATTQELTSSAAYSSVICRPLVTSSVTGSATVRSGSNPSNSHRFMVSLLTAETCAKLETEDGELFKGYWLIQSSGLNSLTVKISKSELNLQQTLTDSLSQWRRILMWQPMIQQRIRLTVICHRTPPAVHRIYMRHQLDSSSCLLSGQKICLFLLTCHFETRWDWLTFAVLKWLAHTGIMVKPVFY